MNKTELVKAIADTQGIAVKDAEKAVNGFMEVVKSEVAKGNPVQLIGFGTFTVGKRAEKTGINPQTKEKMVIPACKAPKFKAGADFKAKVNA